MAVTRASGKYAGCGGHRDVAAQAGVIRAGAQFLTTQTDIGMLLASATAWVDGIRKQIR
jgi:hypothetical protein